MQSIFLRLTFGTEAVNVHAKGGQKTQACTHILHL